MPNSGKTTLIHRLYEDLPKQNISVQIQREDAEIVPNEIPKRTWDRNVWITFGQLQSLVQAYHSSKDVVLLDRGIFDAFFWANLLHSDGSATLEQSQALESILKTMCTNMNFYPDYLFFIDVSVEESMIRRSLVNGISVYSQFDFLENYRNKFFDVFSKYIREHGETQLDSTRCYYFDTTYLSAEEVYEKVSQQIKKLL